MCSLKKDEMTLCDGTSISVSLNQVKLNHHNQFLKCIQQCDRISLIFLISSNPETSRILFKKNAIDFKNWLFEEKHIGEDGISSDLNEALQLIQNFKALRLTSNSVVKGQGLCSVKRALYKMCESLDTQQTLSLNQAINKSLIFEGYLEEQLIEWEIKGIIKFHQEFYLDPIFESLEKCQFNEVYLALKNALKTCEKVEKVTSDFYEIVNPTELGWCVIINQMQFYKGENSEESLQEDFLPRTGSEFDVIALHETFKKLGFNVKVHSDVPRALLYRLLQSYAKRVSSQHSMIIIILLSHGSEDVVYSSDSLPIKIDELEMFFQGKNCTQLLSRPKIFIVQSCQGKEWQRIETDGIHQNELSSKVGPQKGDCLIAWSTVRGFASFRDRLRGSWFIQALCRELESSGKSRDFLDILTRVNLQLRNQTHRQQFMVPWIASSLCKKIVFY